MYVVYFTNENTWFFTEITLCVHVFYGYTRA